MSEETKDENKQPSPEEAIQAIQSSIANAFNLGLQQQPKEGADTIADMLNSIQETI